MKLLAPLGGDMRLVAILLFAVTATVPLAAQEDGWKFDTRLEIRAHARHSEEYAFQSRFPFPPEALPPGQQLVHLATPDPGTRGEVSLISLQLDVAWGELFSARARADGIDLYSRNPTSGDRKIDAEELWIRVGQAPEGLELPDGTSFFAQAGKAPKMERQPVRLLETYGIAANAFNRFNDVQVMVGGSVGRNVYWRAQISNGNPVFIRDTNVLAGDNGVEEIARRETPPYAAGFPILYDAEVEDYFLDTEDMERGFGVGYRWAREDGSLGFDVLVFDYRRDLADTVDMHGSFYGGDLDVLVVDEVPGLPPVGLPIRGREKSETGGRVHFEWGGLAFVGQYVDQTIAGLERDGYEAEVGYEIPLGTVVTFIQPAVRYSEIDNHFRGPRTFPSPSLWWDWRKTDFGVRIGLPWHFDLTVEHTIHDIEAADPRLDLRETLATVRFRI